jgi:hypothetical protein
MTKFLCAGRCYYYSCKKWEHEQCEMLLFCDVDWGEWTAMVSSVGWSVLQLHQAVCFRSKKIKKYVECSRYSPWCIMCGSSWKCYQKVLLLRWCQMFGTDAIAHDR